jgi:alpha,alpha-trehalase
MPKQIHNLGELFEAVQAQNILGDGKAFPDCTPLRPTEDILSSYEEEKKLPGFDLLKFVNENFSLPVSYSTTYTSDRSKSARGHVESLWDVLTRTPDDAGGSLIPLPHPYIVPGGRFREIYYWDSYFTMLGLEVSGRIEMIRNMVDNFAFLIDAIGYIPNGNRTYFIGRSQPPFFSLMVTLLNKYEEDALSRYLPQLEKEYQFWMNGFDSLSENNFAHNRVVRLPDGAVLNRYWDDHDTPRPESFKEDVELTHQSEHKPEVLYRHLRAAAESGWDFSCRWFRDVKSFGTIHTTEIIPIDLNCLLYNLEHVLSKACKHAGNKVKSEQYYSYSEKRKTAILHFCWNETKSFFVDYDFVLQQQKEQLTLAGIFPLFFELAEFTQACAVEQIVKDRFLKPGGLTTTLMNSGQQWDAPNGWAPLQWIAYKGLSHYRFTDTAHLIKTAWTLTNEKVYATTGKMTEKYDVWNSDGEASGGEYPNQDGFGWTNGVYLALMNETT